MDNLKKNIFLIDGIGGFLSALTLGIILTMLEIGLPDQILFTLSSIAFIYGIYSLSCHFGKKTQPIWLKVISIANLTYCLATIVILFLYYKQMTTLGIIYFILEILIIFTVVWIEFRLITFINKDK